MNYTIGQILEGLQTDIATLDLSPECEDFNEYLLEVVVYDARKAANRILDVEA